MTTTITLGDCVTIALAALAAGASVWANRTAIALLTKDLAALSDRFTDCKTELGSLKASHYELRDRVLRQSRETNNR